MKLILYTISLLWIILGAIQILYTDKSNAVLRKLMAERNPKVLAVVPSLIGILICVASLSHYSKEGVYRPLWFVFALGLMACIKGILFFLLPPQHTKKILHWWFNKASDRFIRLWGIILVIMGIAIISWI